MWLSCDTYSLTWGLIQLTFLVGRVLGHQTGMSSDPSLSITGHLGPSFWPLRGLGHEGGEGEGEIGVEGVRSGWGQREGPGGPHVPFGDDIWMPGEGQLRARHLTHKCFIPSTSPVRQTGSAPLNS